MSAEIDKIIDRYLEHPEDPEAWEAARTPEGFAVLIRRCLALANSVPARSLSPLEAAFRTVCSPCDFVQVFGVQAVAHLALGNCTVALEALEQAFRIGGACPSCLADLHRRRSTLHAAMGQVSEAFTDAETCIELYRKLGVERDHDLHGNGLAKGFYARGDIRQYIGIDRRDQVLIQGAIEDFTTALELTDPNASPVLYRACLSGLAVPLYATGNPEDLARSYGYLSQARRRMGSATSKPSQERGKLAWVTAMVEHELIAHRRVLPREVVLDMNRRGVRPVRVRGKLRDAVSDFVKVGMPQETTAAVADLAKILFHKCDPEPDYGAVRELVSGVLERLERRFELPDVASRVSELGPIRAAVDRLVDACNPERWNVYFRVKSAIDGLREAAGPGMIPCLIRWRDG